MSTSSPFRRRHPALEGTPKGVWCPEAVGRVRGYPKTEEAFAERVVTLKANSDRARANGRTKRTGIPNGWGGRRGEVEQLREEANDEAWRRVNVLYRNSQSEDERLTADHMEELKVDPMNARTDAERAALALAFMIGIVISPAYGTSLCNQAARILLPFVRPKPVTGRAATGLDAALAWLDGLTGSRDAA